MGRTCRISPRLIPYANCYNDCMPERLYQYRLDGDLEDVTPRGFKGLAWPEAKPAELVKLGRFVREVREQLTIATPGDAAGYFMSRIFTPFEDFQQEELWVLLLNTKNRPTHEVMVYRGTINTVHLRAAEIYKEAIRLNAPAIVMAHCHPSGAVDPSPDDVRTTQLVREAGQLLDIELLDHIIVGKDVWVSLKAKGLGF